MVNKIKPIAALSLIFLFNLPFCAALTIDLEHDPLSLRLNGTNSPTAEISWGSQNLTGVTTFEAVTGLFEDNAGIQLTLKHGGGSLTTFHQDSGDFTINSVDLFTITSGGGIELKLSGDLNDYIRFSTDANVPQIMSVGANMKYIADGGTHDFDNDNILTTGNIKTEVSGASQTFTAALASVSDTSNQTTNNFGLYIKHSMSIPGTGHGAGFFSDTSTGTNAVSTGTRGIFGGARVSNTITSATTLTEYDIFGLEFEAFNDANVDTASTFAGQKIFGTKSLAWIGRDGKTVEGAAHFRSSVSGSPDYDPILGENGGAYGDLIVGVYGEVRGDGTFTSGTGSQLGTMACSFYGKYQDNFDSKTGYLNVYGLFLQMDAAADANTLVWGVYNELSVPNLLNGSLVIGRNTDRNNQVVPTATLEVVGDAFIGDGTNETRIGSTGDLVFVGSAGLVYGGISTIENAVETAIASATVKVQVTIFDRNMPSNNITPDNTENHILITVAGDYHIVVSTTVNSVGGSGSVMELEVMKNNGASRLGHLHADRSLGGGGTERGSIGLSDIVTLAAPVAATRTTYAFVDSNPDTITDSSNNFVADGFAVGQTLTIAGSTSNDGDYTIATVAVGTLTLIAADTLTAEVAGDTVTATGSETIEVWIENETNTQNYVVEDITLQVIQLGG